MRPLRAMLPQYRVDRLEPLARLNRINVIKWIESAHKSFTIGSPNAHRIVHFGHWGRHIRRLSLVGQALNKSFQTMHKNFARFS